MKTRKLSFAALASFVALSPVAALAGPCSDDIATVGRQLSQSPAMGPVTTGTLSGSTPSRVAQPASDSKGTSADAHVGGTAGTKEMDAASATVATSDADVRQQQMGHPTAAGQAQGSAGTETASSGRAASAGAGDDRMSRAKAAWQKAVDLNAQNDQACTGAIQQAKADLQPG